MGEQRGSGNVTQLLRRWRAGEVGARDRLMAVVYPELQQLARRYLRSERVDHTLVPTALVHEAYLRLVDSEVDWQDRAHFFAVAARVMRHVLVDHGKQKRRQKRGGQRVRITLDESFLSVEEAPPDIVAIDEALDLLERIDERKARVVELHFFGGLNYEETAEVLGISTATVGRELRFAKAWLHNHLVADNEPE